MPAPHPIRIGDSITGQSFAQVFCLADIEHSIGPIAHKINTGTLGRVAKELRPESLDQGLGIRK